MKKNRLENFTIFSLIISCMYLQQTIFIFQDYDKKNYFFLFFRMMSIVTLALITLYFCKCSIHTKKIRKILATILFFICYFWGNYQGRLILLLGLYIGLFMIKDSPKMYKGMYKFMACICFLGLISFMFLKMGLNLNLVEVEANNSLKTLNGISYLKHYFLGILKYSGNYISPRFQSIFDEPGSLGTIIGTLLIFDNLKSSELKFSRYILIVSGFFTQSLAFFILILLKIVTTFYKSNRKLKRLAKLFLFSFMLMMSIKYIDSKYLDNVFHHNVIRKIVELESNRENDSAKVILDNFMKGENVFWGKRESFYSNYPNLDISSWRIIVYEKGLISLMLLLIYYLYVTEFITQKKEIKICIFLFLINLYQRPELITSSAYLFILISGIENLKLKNEEISWKN